MQGTSQPGGFPVYGKTLPGFQEIAPNQGSTPDGQLNTEPSDCHMQVLKRWQHRCSHAILGRMERRELFKLTDLIMNKLSEADFQVVKEAVIRRDRGSSDKGPMGINPARLAREAGASMEKQVGYSIEGVREMVRGYVSEIIRQNAPELGDKEVDQLLDTWVPEGGEAENRKPVPGDLLLTMIQQFVAFGKGEMSSGEQLRLQQEIPDWHTVYWNRFSSRIRELIALHIKAGTDEKDFWKEIYEEIG